MSDCCKNNQSEENCCRFEDTPEVKYFHSYRKDGTRYTPTFSEAVDQEKCIGCGKCVKVCGQGVYVLIEVNGEKKSHNANADRCLGDCHCHKACPVDALICIPKIIG